MKKILTLLCGILTVANSFAQLNTNYGLIRKNYYTSVFNPIDSTYFNQFDSCTTRLGTIDAATGIVNNSGTWVYSGGFNLTGAALNPYDNTYIFIGMDGIKTLDLASGSLLSTAPLNNPIAASYFDNFYFNNSDSTMYGLARRFLNGTGEIYLAKANTTTGLITQISPSSVAQGYTLAGGAIDPFQMVYYFITGDNLVGLDLYNGAVYSNVQLSFQSGFAFGNFTYSCADTSLYGLVRQNYFSYYPDPFSPGDSIMVLDSSDIKLGKVDPATGIVTNVSPYGILTGGYSLNASAVIDPSTLTYYFSNGPSIIGVSLVTGLITSNSGYQFPDGDYFDLMRNFQNCITAHPVRSDPGTVGLNEANDQAKVTIWPNPVADNCYINSTEKINRIELLTIEGKVLQTLTYSSAETIKLDLSDLTSGVYILKLATNSGNILTRKLLVKN